MFGTLALFLTLAQPAYREQFPLPDATIPAGLGVNVHFIEPGDNLHRIAEAGFKWIRTDFSWSRVERTRGEYDFSRYDKLLSGLSENHLRAILILDYGNPLYQEGAPRSEEARAAFVRWAHASLQHFRHRGIVWEMYNEPNGKFWKPAPNAAEYATLAKEVGQEIRANEPDEWFIGPSVTGIDLKFLKSCFSAGLLDYWDAVSVHPYRGHRPETVLGDYAALKGRIAEFAGGKSIPIICSEWGYPDSQYSEETQADFLAREYLCGLMADVPITIWYDWTNDAYDPAAPDESHFGVVDRDLGEKEPLRVVRALTQALRGWKLAAVVSDKPYLYLLKFSRGGEVKYLAWCWDANMETFHMPSGSYTVTPLGGEPYSAEADGAGLRIELGPRPVVLMGER